MSAQSFSNLANSEFNGNIVLNNGYIKFPDNSIQTTAGGGGGGGNVSTSTINTYTNTSVNNFEAAEITCDTQVLGDNSTYVANTAFVQNALSNTVSTDQDNTFEVGFTQTFNGGVDFTSSVDITSYTASNIIGQPLLGSMPTITDSVLLGNSIGDGITNINGTIAIGNNSAFSTTTNTNGIAIGKDSDLNIGFTNNIAIGYQASANANNSIVIGANVGTSNDNEIVLGNSSNYVTLNSNGSLVVGYSSINSIGTSTTSWTFITSGLPKFNILLATNIPALLPQVYTGSYNLIPQFYNFTISSAVLQDTTVNAIFTATNPNAQTQPVNFTGLYACGINTLVNSIGALSATEPTDFGSAYFNNVDTNTTATISPYFPTITGTCYLNITTQWDGTDYVVYTTYDFQEVNMSSNTTFNIGFNSNNYSQQIDINYTGGNLTTPISLQLSIK